MGRSALLLVAVLLFPLVAGIGRAASAATPGDLPAVGERAEQAELDWFRDQLHIDPKYQQQEEGVLGMSWRHFLTMLFLLLFSITAMVLHLLHTRRRQQLIDTMLKEEGEEKPGGA